MKCEDELDFRIKSKLTSNIWQYKSYPQVFEDRNGFHRWQINFRRHIPWRSRGKKMVDRCIFAALIKHKHCLI